MKIVGISQNINFKFEINEIRDEIDQRLISFVFECGYIPIQIPNSLGKSLENWVKETNINAILLSGGNDIGQYKIRDNTEVNLLNFAYKNKLPLLGICRGMQMIGHLFGVKLHEVKEHKKTRHEIYGKINKEVNSFHLYSLKECPKNFEVLAKSKDGEIEAIRHKLVPFEGWMWHPEREKKFCEYDVQRVKHLFDD